MVQISVSVRMLEGEKPLIDNGKTLKELEKYYSVPSKENTHLMLQSADMENGISTEKEASSLYSKDLA